MAELTLGRDGWETPEDMIVIEVTAYISWFGLALGSLMVGLLDSTHVAHTVGIFTILFSSHLVFAVSFAMCTYDDGGNKRK